jgi:hypothetical protein
MTKVGRLLVVVAFVTCAFDANNQSKTNDAQVNIPPKGISVLKTTLRGKHIRVVLNTTQIEIGASQPRVEEQLTNCLYTRRPCSQVQNVSIWVGEKRLVIPRSVFADCADLNVMYLVNADKFYELTLSGGDGAESYLVKVYFDSDRIVRREVYGGESEKLYETSTYMPVVVD